MEGDWRNRRRELTAYPTPSGGKSIPVKAKERWNSTSNQAFTDKNIIRDELLVSPGNNAYYNLIALAKSFSRQWQLIISLLNIE